MTFCTYYTKLPPGVECKWRFVVEGSPEAEAARATPQTLLVQLGKKLPPAMGGALVEAPLVFFEAPTEYAREDLSHLRGKAVVHLGCHIESRAAYQRLMQAEPAFLLFVDIRYLHNETRTGCAIRTELMFCRDAV